MHCISITTSAEVRKFKKLHREMWLNIRFGNLFSIFTFQRFALQIVAMLSLLWQWNLLRKWVIRNIRREICRNFKALRQHMCSNLWNTIKILNQQEPESVILNTCPTLVTCCVALSDDTIGMGGKFTVQDNGVGPVSRRPSRLKQLNKWASTFR